MNADDSLERIARELRLIREAQERMSPPPPSEPKPRRKQRAVVLGW